MADAAGECCELLFWRARRVDVCLAAGDATLPLCGRGSNSRLLLGRWRCLVLLMVAQMAVDALYIGEDALPVRVLHFHHVVDVQQRCDVCLLFSGVEGQGEVVSSLLGVQLVKVEGIREEVMDESTERHTVVPAGGEVGDLHSRVTVGLRLGPVQQDLLYSSRASG